MREARELLFSCLLLLDKIDRVYKMEHGRQKDHN